MRPCFSSSRVFGSRGGGGDGRTAEVRGWDSRGGVRVEREQRHRREEKRKGGGEGRGGGTVAITSLENRLLVSCSCLDCPLSIYLTHTLSLSLSLTVSAASVPRGACQISQSHTLFPSGGCTKRQCRQSLDSDLCAHSWRDSNPPRERTRRENREVTRHTGIGTNSRQACSIQKLQVQQHCLSSVMFFSLLHASLVCLLCWARESVCARVSVSVWLCESVWVCVRAAGCSTLWGRLKGSARALPCSSSSTAWWVGLRAGCNQPLPARGVS